MSNQDIKDLRAAMTPVVDCHAECFKPGQATNRDRFVGAASRLLPTLLTELEQRRELDKALATWMDYIGENEDLKPRDIRLLRTLKAFFKTRKEGT